MELWLLVAQSSEHVATKVQPKPSSRLQTEAPKDPVCSRVVGGRAVLRGALAPPNDRHSSIVRPVIVSEGIHTQCT